MTETAHTPGPWNLVWRRNEQYPYPLSVLADDSGAWVARGGKVSSEANARLIAAAPDMLEALQAIVDEFPVAAGTAKGIPHDEQGYGSIYRARAAIARATGEKEAYQ